jgi:hypothetical protein
MATSRWIFMPSDELQEIRKVFQGLQRLTLDLLKVISESEGGIVKVSGDYTGSISGRWNRENTTRIGFISIRSTNGGTNLW